jgi:hypothetical protein
LSGEPLMRQPTPIGENNRIGPCTRSESRVSTLGSLPDSSGAAARPLACSLALPPRAHCLNRPTDEHECHTTPQETLEKWPGARLEFSEVSSVGDLLGNPPSEINRIATPPEETLLVTSYIYLQGQQYIHAHGKVWGPDMR